MLEFTTTTRPAPERPKVSISKALPETLADGGALRVAVNGETYAVVRNRVAATGYPVARRCGAKLCTRKSEDGAALLIWLEPK